jgi:glycosyltransferase involved in cell wall biosynthesis
MKLSIIIPTFNEAEWLPFLLKSIQSQHYRDFEIIIADNDSTDMTVHIATQNGCNIVKGGTPAIGRNRGAIAAKGEYLLFLDADVVLSDQDFIEMVMRETEDMNADIATCRIFPLSDRKIDLILHGAVNQYIHLTSKIYPHAPGFCILVKQTLHKRIGGFDEQLQLAEDHEYVKRATKVGKYIVLSSKPIFVSVRRLEKDGRFRIAMKYMYVEFYRLVKGEIYFKIFTYNFGHDLHPKNNDILNQIKIQRPHGSILSDIQNCLANLSSNRSYVEKGTARNLFARYGLEKTTTEDIASGLNLRKGALYYYFKTKEELFSVVIREEIERLQKEIEEEVLKAKSSNEKFSAFLKARMCYLKRKADEFTTIRDEYMRHYSFIESLRKEYNVWEKNVIRKIIADGVKAGELKLKEIDLVSDTISLAVKGLEYTWITQFSIRQIESNVDRLITILFQGLLHAE